jgi:hypothetical protein
MGATCRLGLDECRELVLTLSSPGPLFGRFNLLLTTRQNLQFSNEALLSATKRNDSNAPCNQQLSTALQSR